MGFPLSTIRLIRKGIGVRGGNPVRFEVGGGALRSDPGRDPADFESLEAAHWTVSE